MLQDLGRQALGNGGLIRDVFSKLAHSFRLFTLPGCEIASTSEAETHILPMRPV